MTEENRECLIRTMKEEGGGGREEEKEEEEEEEEVRNQILISHQQHNVTSGRSNFAISKRIFQNSSNKLCKPLLMSNQLNLSQHEEEKYINVL